MAKPSYEVTRCGPGQERLQQALNEIADRGVEVISIVPDHGDGAFGMTRGDTHGYLIVVRWSS